MNRYYGFDLGDAESALCVLNKDGQSDPVIIRLQDTGSFVTAYARLSDSRVLIGEAACYSPDAQVRRLRFKSLFLEDPHTDQDVAVFADAVRNAANDQGYLLSDEDACCYVGCPAGWDPGARERYRSIFERIGFPPVRIISESRAALVSACRSRHLQVGYDILSRPVLVIDMGSSTTDLAYIMGGKEVSLRTAGEVCLGGGLMDAWLLEEALRNNRDEKIIREIFRESPPWQSYCEFAARRLKERYFSDREYWKEHKCVQNVRILQKGRHSLTLEIDEETVRRMLEGPMKSLGGKSYAAEFRDSLRRARDGISEKLPELIFLTGGVCRLPELAGWCREVFPEAVVITGQEPEFSVSRGLAWCGRIDEELRLFRAEVEDLKDSSAVEQIVGRHIQDLYRLAVESLTQPLLYEAVLPVIERWRHGSIRRLSDIDGELKESVADWLHSEQARELLAGPVRKWLKPVSYDLEEYTVPICVRHQVPYRALSLSSYLSLSEVDIHLDARSVFAVGETTFLIDTIITLVVGLLCGGGGIALIANGLPGIAAGAVISIMVLFLGKEKMQSVLLHADIPAPVRRLLPKRYFESRMDRILNRIQDDFYQSLETEQNEEITDRMVMEISGQIDDCLMKMAEVVEIPLN